MRLAASLWTRPPEEERIDDIVIWHCYRGQMLVCNNKSLKELKLQHARGGLLAVSSDRQHACCESKLGTTWYRHRLAARGICQQAVNNLQQNETVRVSQCDGCGKDSKISTEAHVLLVVYSAVAPMTWLMCTCARKAGGL